MEKIQTGRSFVVRNTKSGTVLDISATDGRSIIGYPFNNGPNQKWTVNWTGQGWTIRSTAGGAFLSIAGTPANDTRLIASSTPFEWHIWHDEVYPGIYRIFVPGTLYNWDLSNYGSLAPGTAVTLWTKWNGIHQTWDFTQVWRVTVSMYYIVAREVGLFCRLFLGLERYPRDRATIEPSE